MDDLFATPTVTDRKRTIRIGDDEYKLQRDILTDQWRCWPVADNTYAEQAAGDEAAKDFRRGTKEWRALYHGWWSAANDPAIAGDVHSSIAAIREGMARDQARRATAEQLARSANLEDALTAAAD